jgi:hypothetical protein
MPSRQSREVFGNGVTEGSNDARSASFGSCTSEASVGSSERAPTVDEKRGSRERRSLVTERDGDFLHGYGVEPSAFLLHVGLLYVVLAVAAVSADDGRSLFVTVGSHVAFFVIGCALM